LETIASADGTSIAFERGGMGPVLVAVHGTTGNRTNLELVRPFLQADLTVVTVDRRGRGDSGDSPDYTIEREYEDVVAVTNALDPPRLLYGHSFGAICALGAAMQSDSISGLVLYEPWMVVDDEKAIFTPAQLERLDGLLANGDLVGVLKAFLVDMVGISSHDMDQIRSEPGWYERIGVARTIPREARATEAYRFPADKAGKLSIPVLLLLGGDSPAAARRVNAMLEAALPNARTVVMPGQQHIADRTGPTSWPAPFWISGAILPSGRRACSTMSPVSARRHPCAGPPSSRRPRICPGV
jgi:pimeloyl-ACP methyl ester carboxylesterase